MCVCVWKANRDISMIKKMLSALPCVCMCVHISTIIIKCSRFELNSYIVFCLFVWVCLFHYLLAFKPKDYIEKFSFSLQTPIKFHFISFLLLLSFSRSHIRNIPYKQTNKHLQLTLRIVIVTKKKMQYFSATIE